MGKSFFKSDQRLSIIAPGFGLIPVAAIQSQQRRWKVAVKRRLKEEMGIDIQGEYAYKFLYRVEFPNNLVEHELDHVYVGQFNDEPKINNYEVESWKYANITTVKNDVRQNPEAYTYWFRLILNHPELEFKNFA